MANYKINGLPEITVRVEHHTRGYTAAVAVMNALATVYPNKVITLADADSDQAVQAVKGEETKAVVVKKVAIKPKRGGAPR